MSKTLFNTNTFQSKTLQNSNKIDIGETNVTTFTATNATITNLTNAELQAATSGVATNASAIGGKQDNITSSNRLNADLIGAGFVSNAEYTHLNGVTSGIQDQLNDKQNEITSTNRLNADLIGAGFVSNAEYTHLNGVTSAIQTQFGDKQDNITASDRLDAGFIGDGTVSDTEYGFLSSVTSNIQTQFTDKQDEITASSRLDAGFIGDGTVSDTEYNFLNGVSNNIQTQIGDNAQKITDMTYDSGASKTTFANDVHVSGALSTTNYTNLNTTVFNNILAIGTNATNISTNATDIATNATDIATNATDIATNTTDIGRNAANITTLQGSISENDTNIATITNNIEGISTSSDVTTIDNKVVISRNATPQLLIQRVDNGGDIEFKMRGKRNGAETVRQAKIDLQNDDDGVINTLCSIAGRVTNKISNIGGLEIINYTDGQTATSALMMSPSGNFNIGGGTVFQDDCKVKITGAMYQTPQMTIYNFDKDIVSNDLWGNGNKQTDLISTRTIGTAFSSHSDGTITFTSTGTYKIKVSGNLQSRYNDRLAFAINLVTLDSTGDVTNNFFENGSYNLFSWLYSRNTSDGAHGNVGFEDYLYITSGNKIEIRNHLDINGVDFNDTLPESNLSLYLNMTITKITDNNIFA